MTAPPMPLIGRALVVRATGRLFPEKVDPATQRTVDGDLVGQAGVDCDPSRCGYRLFFAGLEVRVSETAPEHVQDRPMAGCQGVFGLNGIWQGVLGEDGGCVARDESVRGERSWGREEVIRDGITLPAPMRPTLRPSHSKTLAAIAAMRFGSDTQAST